jgi:hypothetical protein
MRRVRLFHWKANEAAALIKELKRAGHSVDYDEDLRTYWANRKLHLPEVFAIDLSHRPAHGREVAIALRGYKPSRNIPIIFVDGDAAKVEGIKRVIPDAVYTSRDKLPKAIDRAKPPAQPLVPAQMMDRFSGRSAAQKIGIGKGMAVAVVDPPADYTKVVGELPEGVRFEEADCRDCKVTLWFLHDYGSFEPALPRMRRLAQKSKLWILWRKGKLDGIDGNIVRQGANEVGLVDYKICSVNETWSGMAFALKKAQHAR